MSKAKKPIVVMIAAVGTAGGNQKVIGDGKRLPWHLPKDLKFFRRVTINHTVIMGRKTYESFGKRALPKRKNIVITRNADYIAEGCSVYHSLQSALDACSDEKRVFIIGGGEIYSQAIKVADEIILTEILDQNQNDNLFPLFAGTIFFPEIDESIWKITRPGKQKFLASNKISALLNSQAKKKVSQRALYFRVVGYKRIKK
jgi:dihydrofolate reductase